MQNIIKFFYIGQLCSSNDEGLSKLRKVKYQTQGYIYLGQTTEEEAKKEGFKSPRARIMASNGTIWLVTHAMLERITDAEGNMIKGPYATKRYRGQMTHDELDIIEKGAEREIQKLTKKLNT